MYYSCIQDLKSVLGTLGTLKVYDAFPVGAFVSNCIFQHKSV